MRYVKNNTIFNIIDIRKANPNISIPDGADCSDLGYAQMVETPRPDALPWHTVIEGAPDGNTQTWIQNPMPLDEIQRTCINEVQGHLDGTASTRGYDGIMSACTYATDTHPPFMAEGQACVNWRGEVWAKCYQILGEVQTGARPMPTVTELISLLPVMQWPT